MIQGGYCKEKLDASHSWGQRVNNRQKFLNSFEISFNKDKNTIYNDNKLTTPQPINKYFSTS